MKWTPSCVQLRLARDRVPWHTNKQKEPEALEYGFEFLGGGASGRFQHRLRKGSNGAGASWRGPGWRAMHSLLGAFAGIPAPPVSPGGSPQGVPPAGPQMKANAANIKATVLATCSLLLTLAGRPLHWLLLELRIPHQVSCGFSSFLCKLCININIFLTLQILKFIKGKYEIRFFHGFIFF